MKKSILKVAKSLSSTELHQILGGHDQGWGDPPDHGHDKDGNNEPD